MTRDQAIAERMRETQMPGKALDAVPPEVWTHFLEHGWIMLLWHGHPGTGPTGSRLQIVPPGNGNPGLAS